MFSPRLPALVPVLMALAALPIYAAEAPGEGGAAAPNPTPTPAAAPAPENRGALTPEQQKFWTDFVNNPQNSQAQVAAEAKYANALAEYRAAHWVEALELVQESIRLFPSSEKAQKLREDLLALLSVRDNRLQLAATYFHQLQDVKTQELAVRLAALMERGRSRMRDHDYAGAELEFDRVDIGLRSFPYQFDWGPLPAEVIKLKTEARARARDVEAQRMEDMRDDAVAASRNQSQMQEIALKNKVDELLRRARNSYNRQDYKRAEIDSWNAYELDRRREDARKLYLDSRRGGHLQFDEEYREQVIERSARVQEELHRSMIPQNELLVYPEDWHLRALRKPAEQGPTTLEPWVEVLNNKLDSERVTFDFSDASFDDVISYLRKVTDVTFVLANDVIAGGVASPVTLKVDHMGLRDALKFILEQAGLNMALQSEAVYISKTASGGAVVLRMYDVSDLIVQIKDFPGRKLAFNTDKGGAKGGGGIFAANATNQQPVVDPTELMDFIKKNVAPTEWDRPDVGIDQRAGSTLFVTQTPEVHALIDQLLTNMRNQQDLQVHVGVEMIDVQKDFFEEIGMEYTDQTAAGAGTAGPGQSSLPYPILLANSPVTPIPNAGVGVPSGGAAAGNDGFVRLNDTIAYNGSLVQNLPSNSSASTANQTPVGLQLEGSLHAFSFLGVSQLSAIFSAFEQETDSKVLEHPEITCFNGQRANATFIHQYAYISGYDIVNYTYQPRIDILNFGDIIDVLPVVSSDRKYITMDIRPSAVKPVQFFVLDIIAPRIASSGNFLIVFGFVDYPLELPNVEITQLASTVMMPDKGSLLLGGFNATLRQRTHSGVPFLSHIPFLGRLFSRDGTYDQDRRIFFLLKAEIVDLGEKEKLQ